MELDNMGTQRRREQASGNPVSREPLRWDQMSREMERRGGLKGAVVEPLRYPSAGGEDCVEAEAPAAEVVAGQEWTARLVAKEAEWKARCEAVRQEALAQGRAELEGRRMELLIECAGQWHRAVEDFRQARESYFARVEREVVELSLAIAARIIQREAQLDPLLLSGAVRVALGQLQEAATVELRVPAASHEMWSETLRLMPNLPVVPKVVTDNDMKDGECVLTTEAGRVDLGVKAQLKEIERGFFDLLSHRAPACGRDAARGGL